MAVHKVMINLMEMFTKLSFSPDQAVINDLDNVTQEQLERNNKLLFVEYTSDVYSTTPSCMCGHLSKEYWLGRKCSKCNTIVQDKVQQQLPAPAVAACTQRRCALHHTDLLDLTERLPDHRQRP